MDQLLELRRGPGQLAVQAVGTQHKKAMVETYVETSASLRGEDDGDGLQVYAPDPAEVYRTSLQYQRRVDLVHAFEAAAHGDGAASRVNVVV